MLTATGLCSRAQYSNTSFPWGANLLMAEIVALPKIVCVLNAPTCGNCFDNTATRRRGFWATGSLRLLVLWQEAKAGCCSPGGFATLNRHATGSAEYHAIVNIRHYFAGGRSEKVAYPLHAHAPLCLWLQGPPPRGVGERNSTQPGAGNFPPPMDAVVNVRHPLARRPPGARRVR